MGGTVSFRQMRRIGKQLKRAGLKKVLTKKNSHMFYCNNKELDGDTFVGKFKARWGHEPTSFCFLVNKEGFYVLLSPVSLD